MKRNMHKNYTGPGISWNLCFKGKHQNHEIELIEKISNHRSGLFVFYLLDCIKIYRYSIPNYKVFLSPN